MLCRSIVCRSWWRQRYHGRTWQWPSEDNGNRRLGTFKRTICFIWKLSHLVILNVLLWRHEIQQITHQIDLKIINIWYIWPSTTIWAWTYSNLLDKKKNEYFQNFLLTSLKYRNILDERLIYITLIEKYSIFSIQWSKWIVNIIRRRQIQCCVLLLYVVVAESCSTIRELDSGQTIIMETGGMANTTLLSLLPENFLTLTLK